MKTYDPARGTGKFKNPQLYDREAEKARDVVVEIKTAK